MPVTLVHVWEEVKRMRKREDRYHNNQWTVKVEWRSQAVIALYPYIRPISSYIGNWVYTAGTTTPSPHHHHRLHPEGGVVGGAKLEARQLPGTLETVCVCIFSHAVSQAGMQKYR